MIQKLVKAEVLQEKYKVPDSIYDGKFTKTSQFMVPAIGINVTNPLVFRFFENAFLTDLGHKHNYERPIFMLFSIPDFNDINWKKVYNTLITSKNFITEYDIGVQNGKFLLMMVFSIPKEFEQDYYNFRAGKYSKFSKKYRENFPEFLDKTKKKKNIHWEIINKDPRLKEQIQKTFSLEDGVLTDEDEIWDAPRKEREYYRFKK